MTAEELAKSLAAKFLQNGNYEALGAALSDRSVEQFVSAAATQALEETFERPEGFAGLSVQSVGYTAGSDDEHVIVYVTRGSSKALKEVPKKVDQVQVETRVMGKLRATPSPAMASSGTNYFYERSGRIACGGSIAPSRENYAGTLGAFAKNVNQVFAISNNHVFAACNHTPVGMPILGPANMDAKPGRRAPTEVCVYRDMIELRSGVPSLVTPMNLDAAFGEVVNATVISSWQGDDVQGYDTPANTVQPAAGVRVKKFGRTTGLTTGVIEALVPTPWVLPYKSARFTSQVWFQDTWTIRGDGPDAFALPGDSGSLVVTEDGSAAVGLVFAVNARGGYAIFCPIAQVLQRFGNLQLLSNHGISLPFSRGGPRTGGGTDGRYPSGECRRGCRER
jgi:hypothetical protein